MNNNGNHLSFWSEEAMACVKIAGRANFSASLDFKNLIINLQGNGCHRFVLDLTKCLIMDSTFLGVLAGLGRKFQKEEKGTPRPSIEILNPNNRIADLLDNLGVVHLFKVVHAKPTQHSGETEITPKPGKPDMAELSRTSLEAHEILMEINPDNVPKFRDVARYLAEEVRKHKKD